MTPPPTPHLPALPADWEPTRATLHAYARGVASLPRALAPAHPRWWHVSLKVTPIGLVTDPVATRDGGSLQIRMDLVHHEVVAATSDGRRMVHSLIDAGTGTQFTRRLLMTAAELGAAGEVDASRFESDQTRSYDPGHATTFWHLLTGVAAVLEAQRSAVGEPVSPLQVWPHGFDLAFEWFGTRTVPAEEADVAPQSAQINFGFYPAGDAYFYSNPWPFEPGLTDHDLPHGASWHTEDWTGTMLPLSAIAEAADGSERLLEYYQRVFEIALPTLVA